MHCLEGKVPQVSIECVCNALPRMLASPRVDDSSVVAPKTNSLPLPSPAPLGTRDNDGQRLLDSDMDAAPARSPWN